MTTTRAKQEWISRLTGAISGLLLATPNVYPVLAPLQIIALLPIFYLCTRDKTDHSTTIIAGVYMGLFYTLPQMIALRLPIPITLILVIYLTILITIFACVSARLLRQSSLFGAFAVGAFLVLLDWTNFTVVPIWGTAQSIVRSWSQYPNLIQFTSLTGMTGIIFVLATLQALIIKALSNPKLRVRFLTVAALVMLIVAAADITILTYQQPADKLKVAAIGWTDGNSQEDYSPQTQEGFKVLFARPAAKAAAQGARLIVSPEMGFCINKVNRADWLNRFQTISSKHNVFLVVGYFDTLDEQNRLMFISPDARTLPEYTKTHLTPFEHFPKGDGQLRTIDLEGIKVGGMICQDDNFTDLSREYGRNQTSIVAVPTLDWSTVKNAHLQNSIHRAIESRYAIVRAARNGISAIISPTGTILARRDHFLEGSGFIVAEVPICKFRTFFSIAGNWLVALSLVFLIINISGSFAAAWLKRRISRK